MGKANRAGGKWGGGIAHIALAIFLVAHVGLVHGQFAGVRFRSVTSANGLSHDVINTITRDQEGYMWFGTFSGLNRYDGYHVEVFRHDRNDSLSIPDNSVRCSLSDTKGRLWFGTERGLCVWNGNRGFNLVGEGTRLENLHITSLDEDASGQIWVGTRKGVFVISGNIEIDESPLVKFGEQDTKLSITDIHVSGHMVYMVHENHGVLIADIRSDNLLKMNTTESGWQKLLSDDVKEIAYGADRSIWIGYRNGTISSHDPSFQKAIVFPELSTYTRGDFTNELTELQFDQTGNLWASGSLSGLSVLTPGANGIVTLRDIPSITEFSNTRSARCIYVDHEGTIWLGMHTSGILYFNPTQQIFFNYQRPTGVADQSREDILLSNWTRAFAEDPQGRLWIGTVDGVSILDRSKDSFEAVRNTDSHKTRIAGNSIRSLLNYKDQMMLIGTAEGLSVFDFDNQHIHTFKSDDADINSLPGGFIWDMCQYQQGVLLATSSGLAYYNAKAGRVETWSEQPEVREKLNFNARSILVDQSGIIWSGTGNGLLVRFDPASGGIDSYEVTPLNTSGGGAILCMSDADECIWIGTETGLFRFRKSTRSSELISLGLARNPTMIACFVQTDAEHLWMTSADGLICYDIQNKKATLYSTIHGLPSNVLGSQRGFATRDGWICLAGLQGVTLFDPVRLAQQRQQPLPRITSVVELKSGKQLFLDDGRLNLEYDENFFTIELNTFQYVKQDQLVYSYMLEGFHDDWVNAGNNRILTFTNVPGGDYVLRLKASESGATIGDEYSSLSVHIDTVYYKTMWFRALIVAFALATVYAIYLIRQRQMKAIESLRQKIAADLHDDIGSTLSSIRLYSDVAVKSPGDSAALLEKISRNSSTMIDRMSDIVWAIKPGYDDLQTLGGRLRDFSIELCGPSEIEFEYHFDDSLTRLRPGMEMKKELYLTLKEAINNAIKHSDCKRLSLTFSDQRPNMVIVVKDDGKGFHSASADRGNGLRNMKMRVERIKGKFSMDSRNGEGTRIEISIPFTLFG